jgi:hypothetical protein
MANMFEKPIAANPISTFAALPLQFMQRAIDVKQQRYDQAKADIEQREDDLLQTHALQGDTAEHQELLQGYHQKIEDIAESSGGDLSQVQGQLDRLKTSMKRDMNYGKLGAMNTAYASAIAEKGNLDKLYQAGKIQKSGYDLGMRQISQHKTVLDEAGTGYNTFQRYNPSSETDAIGKLNASVDEITAKYDQQGQKFVNQDLIKKNLSTAFEQNPELVNSMRENFLANYSGKTPGEDFTKYFDKAVSTVISNKQYQQKVDASKRVNGQGDIVRGREWGNINIPNAQGQTAFKGGTMPFIKEMLSKVGMAGGTEEFKKYVDSDQGQKEIKYMNKNSDTPFPTKGSHTQQVAWIEENALKPVSGKVISVPVPETMINGIISKQGALLTRGAIMDESGAVIDPTKVGDLQPAKSGENPTVVSGIVGPDSALPYGTIILTSKDGRTYYQENTDTEILGSKEYAESLLNSVKVTNTGSKPVTLSRTVYDKTTGTELIAAGKYLTEFNQNTRIVSVTQNGKLKYMIKSDGSIVSFGNNNSKTE